MKDPAGFLAKLRKNDPLAWRDAVKYHQSAIRAICGRILKDPEDIHDMTQNTFLKASANIGRFRGTCNLRTWVTRIAINECRQYLRKTKSRDYPRYNYRIKTLRDARFVEQKLLLPDPFLSDALNSCIRSLPTDYQMAFVMHDIEHWQANEIADMLGISLPSAKSKIFRARLLLREKLTCLKIHAAFVARPTKKSRASQQARSEVQLAELPQ